MILGLVVTAVLGVFSTLAGLMPTWTLPSVSHDSAIPTYIHLANSILPLTTVALAIAAYGALMLAMSGWDLIVWVYHQFWGSD